MTAHIYGEADAPLDPLKGKRIAVIGYGSQGHAHALNAHDSGLDVMVGLYQGSKSADKARDAGLTVTEVPEAVKQADVVVMLIPDEKQRSPWSGRMASTSITSRSCHPKVSTCGWSRPKRLAIACASCSSRVRACRHSWPSSRTRPATHGHLRLPTVMPSAQPKQA